MSSATTEQHQSPRKTVIQNVRVFNGNAVGKQPQTIVIEGGRIVSDSSNADTIVDGGNGVLMPGLIDAHVHILEEHHFYQLAKYGVTTALDMAMYPLERIESVRRCHRQLTQAAPDFRTAGVPVSKEGSVHSCVLPLPQESFLKGPEEAEGWVQRRVNEGSDYIKIIADVPGPSQETMNAVVVAAHKYGKKVVAHASSHIPFRMAMEAECDIITHLPVDKSVDAEMADWLLAHKTICVPTLCMMQETTKQLPVSAVVPMLLKPKVMKAVIRNHRSGVGKHTYANGRDSVAALYKAGVTILAGTDCHEEPNSVFDVRHGVSIHREMELMVEAGMSPVDVLRAATVLPAETFGLVDRGVIAEGKRADLVLLSEDPTEDIRATRGIRRVWCNGVEVKR